MQEFYVLISNNVRCIAAWAALSYAAFAAIARLNGGPIVLLSQAGVSTQAKYSFQIGKCPVNSRWAPRTFPQFPTTTQEIRLGGELEVAGERLALDPASDPPQITSRFS